MKIGIDIGGVLVGKRQASNQLFDVPDSYQALQYLAKHNYLYIISYSKEPMAQANYDSLDDLNLFWAQYYVSDKSFKSSIISYLKCNVMIDDNENILNQIKTHNPNVTTILFQRYNKQKKRTHRKHHLVNDWSEIIEILENLKITNDQPDYQPDPQGTAYFISD